MHFPTWDTITRRTISSGPSAIKSPYAIYICVCVYVCIYVYVYHYVYHRNYIYLLMFYSHFERKKLKNLQSGPFTCGQAWLQHSSGCLPKNGRVFRCVAKENEESDPYGYNFIFLYVSHILKMNICTHIYICICMYVYNIIQLRTNPMSLQRPKLLKTAGFCSVLNLHPCFFSKSCSTGTQETWEPRRAALKASVTLWPVAHSFYRIESKICWRPGCPAQWKQGPEHFSGFLHVLRPRDFWRRIVCLMQPRAC